MKYCEGIPKKKRKKKRFEKKKKSATFAVTMTLNFFPPKLMVVRFMRRVCDDGRTTPHPSLPSYAYNSRTILAIFFIALLFIDPPFPLPCVNSPTAALGYFDVSSAPRPVVESRRRRSATYGVEAPFHSRRFHRVGRGAGGQLRLRSSQTFRRDEDAGCLVQVTRGAGRRGCAELVRAYSGLQLPPLRSPEIRYKRRLVTQPPTNFQQCRSLCSRFSAQKLLDLVWL